ncbi:Crp/Fnr family transcriptional regulator [Bacillus sp. 2205SS5-2]|uniref:Crp/Fnr family transcriptional regulator n=1 Tax=Bacillus sp. 2205SS5-2 TaxID=3109031 RepID=UPI0030066FB4
MRWNDIQAHFQAVPLFKELSTEELIPFVDISITRTFNPKSLVFMQEDVLDRVFFIHSGKVKIYRNDAAGKEQIVSVLQAGEMFPHAGFFRKGTFPANAEIIETAQLIVMPIVDFEKVLIKNPELCIKIFKVLGEKIVDLQNRLEEKILHNTYEQIIMLLIRLSKSNGTLCSVNLYKITTNFTNRELANMIGTTRETVSRTLNTLRKKKLIELDKQGCYIINLEKLQNELLY